MEIKMKNEFPLTKEEELDEFYDDEETLNEKIQKLIQLIKESKHCVFFTGAGISISSGIPDLMSPNGLLGSRRKRELRLKEKEFWKWKPSLTHLGILELMKKKIVKYLITINLDALHMRSGVPFNKMSELHGNTNMEYCTKCGTKFFRLFKTRNALKKNLHLTGRKCDYCGGDLMDSTINYDEKLPEEAYRLAEENCEKADLVVVWGSSLRISPANSLPSKSVEKGNGKLVMINLQKTHKDKYASLLVRAKSDDVMKRLLKEFGLEVDIWRDKLIDFILEQNEKKEKKESKENKENKEKKENKENKENLELRISDSSDSSDSN